MSDFSAFALFTAGLAALAPLASAYTQPKGDSPSGNAIYEPGLNSVVPVGKAFTITWEPTTAGSISLLLCKGPSTNCVITQTIADSIGNSGSYAWTPSSDLAPSQPTGYGIQLVVEGTGQYQYSTQFGISNPDYVSSSSSSAVASTSASSSAASSAASSATASSEAAVTAKGKAVDNSTSSSVLASATALALSAANSTITSSAILATGTGSGSANSVNGTGYGHASSGWGYANSTIVKPTGSLTVPSSLQTSTATGSKTSSASGSGTASASAVQSGAAGHFSASFGGLAVVAGIAVFAL